MRVEDRGLAYKADALVLETGEGQEEADAGGGDADRAGDDEPGKLGADTEGGEEEEEGDGGEGVVIGDAAGVVKADDCPEEGLQSVPFSPPVSPPSSYATTSS